MEYLINYLYSIRRIIGSLFSPLTIVFLLIVMSLMGLLLFGNSYFVETCLFFSLVVFYASGTGFFFNVLRKAVGDDYPVVHTVDMQIKWIVVLGAGTLVNHALPANHLLNMLSIKRFLEGVRLYHQLPDAILILSGGSAIPEESTATNMGALASWCGIPQERVLLKTSPMNTEDEVTEIKKTVKEELFFLVTASDHMPRAMEYCIEAGLRPIAAPSDSIRAHNFQAKQTWEKYLVSPQCVIRFTQLAHEIFGRLWFKLSKRKF